MPRKRRGPRTNSSQRNEIYGLMSDAVIGGMRCRRQTGGSYTWPAGHSAHDSCGTPARCRQDGLQVQPLWAGGCDLIIAIVGRARAATWTRGFKRQVALYARHPELGADMLARTGSDPLTIAWAREHHSPETAWTVPVEVGRVLRAADQE